MLGQFEVIGSGSLPLGIGIDGPLICLSAIKPSTLIGAAYPLAYVAGTPVSRRSYP
jgi:hypothetical protein